MGYDLHITRRKEWIEEGDDITFEEFVRQVQGDVEFRYPGENGATTQIGTAPRADTSLGWAGRTDRFTLKTQSQSSLTR